MQKLHEMGAKTVVISSTDLGSQDVLGGFGSTVKSKWDAIHKFWSIIYIWTNKAISYLLLFCAWITFLTYNLNFRVLRWVKHTSQIGDAQVSSTFYRDRGPICGAVTSIDAQSSGWSQGE